MVKSPEQPKKSLSQMVEFAIRQRELNARLPIKDNLKFRDLRQETNITVDVKPALLAIALLGAYPDSEEGSILDDLCTSVNVYLGQFGETASEALLLTPRQAAELFATSLKRLHLSGSDAFLVVQDYQAAWSIPIGKDKEIIPKPKAQNSYVDYLLEGIAIFIGQ